MTVKTMNADQLINTYHGRGEEAFLEELQQYLPPWHAMFGENLELAPIHTDGAHAHVLASPHHQEYQVHRSGQETVVLERNASDERLLQALTAPVNIAPWANEHWVARKVINIFETQHDAQREYEDELVTSPNEARALIPGFYQTVRWATGCANPPDSQNQSVREWLLNAADIAINNMERENIIKLKELIARNLDNEQPT